MLHQCVKNWIWVWLELTHNKREAEDVFAYPQSLLLNECLYLGFIIDKMTLLFEELSDVVSKKIVWDYEWFLTLEGLRAGIIYAVRVIVVLTRSAAQYSLLGQLDQIVYVVGHLVQRCKGILKQVFVNWLWIYLSLVNDLPLLEYFVSSKKVVRKETENFVASACPVLNGDFDALADEFFI